MASLALRSGGRILSAESSRSLKRNSSGWAEKAWSRFDYEGLDVNEYREHVGDDQFGGSFMQHLLFIHIQPN
jgi:hypothetical protein